MSSVLLFSKKPILALGLATLIQDLPDIEILGNCSDLDDLVSTLELVRPNYLFLEARDGPDLYFLHDIEETSPATRVVLLTGNVSAEWCWQARKRNVAGILPLHIPADEYRCLIARIVAGESVYLLDQAADEHPVHSVRLSPREGQLVALLSRGLKNKEIAFELGISEATVKAYLSRLFQKVGAKDRLDLALLGLRNLGREELAEPSGEGSRSEPGCVFRHHGLALSKRPPTPMTSGTPLPRLHTRSAARGSAMVEATLVLFFFFALFWLLFDASWAIFVKATLRHAVREGVRYGVTGQTALDANTNQLSQLAGIRQRVRYESMGLLSSLPDSAINVSFCDATTLVCDGTSNSGGNLVLVSIQNYAISPVCPLFRSSSPILVTVQSGDKLEANANAGPPPL